MSVAAACTSRGKTANVQHFKLLHTWLPSVDDDDDDNNNKAWHNN
jgi:hypothetical protein